MVGHHVQRVIDDLLLRGIRIVSNERLPLLIPAHLAMNPSQVASAADWDRERIDV